MLEFVDAVVQQVEPMNGLVVVIDHKYWKQYKVPYSKFFYAQLKGLEIVPKVGSIGLLLLSPEKNVFLPLQATIINDKEKNASKFPLEEGDVAFINDSSLVKISENELLVKYKNGIQIQYDQSTGLFLIKTKSFSLFDSALYYSTNYNDKLGQASPEITITDKPEEEDNYFQFKLFNADELLKLFFTHKEEMIFELSITDKRKLILSLFNLSLSLDKDNLTLNFNDTNINITDQTTFKTPALTIETDEAQVITGDVKLILNRNNGKIQAGDTYIQISDQGIEMFGDNVNIRADQLNLNGTEANLNTQNAKVYSPTTTFSGTIQFRQGQENSFDVTNQQELDKALQELKSKIDAEITKLNTDLNVFKGLYRTHLHETISGVPTTPPLS